MYASAFERELRKLIEEDIGVITDNLVVGAAIKDYADYRHSVGRIHALRRVLEYFEDAKEKLKNA